MVETPLDIPRAWIEFEDPADPDQRVRADLTWLTSSWTCIFGSGCAGVYADRPDDGCCTLGAHFTDDDDIARVSAVVDRLSPDTWQHHDQGWQRGPDSLDGVAPWIEADGEQLKTRVVDGACVFLNRPGFAAGAGCALHHYALRRGLEPHTVKPDVCWQLPIRRSYREVARPDGSEYLEITITEFDRRGWGPGGHDLDWYCSGNPAAHTGREPVFRSNEPELRELLGDAAYAELTIHCDAHLQTVRAARAAGARKLLPLLVHPATMAAKPREVGRSNKQASRVRVKAEQGTGAGKTAATTMPTASTADAGLPESGAEAVSATKPAAKDKGGKSIPKKASAKSSGKRKR